MQKCKTAFFLQEKIFYANIIARIVRNLMYNFRYSQKTGEIKVKVLRATKICCAALTFCYILLCSAQPFVLSAKAEDFGTYLRIITPDTPFFRTVEDKDPLFFSSLHILRKSNRLRRGADARRIRYKRLCDRRIRAYRKGVPRRA